MNEVSLFWDNVWPSWFECYLYKNSSNLKILILIKIYIYVEHNELYKVIFLLRVFLFRQKNLFKGMKLLKFQ